MINWLKRYLNRLYQRQRSYRAGRRGTVYEITHDSSGMHVSWLTLENERGEHSVTWEPVIKITAFKKDLYVVDQICFDFELEGGKGIEIDEEMKGWESLINKLPEYLPGCKTLGEWFHTVAIPAFQPNETSIFEKSR